MEWDSRVRVIGPVSCRWPCYFLKDLIILCWWPLEIVDLLLHMADYHTETMKALCSILYYFYLILKLQSIGFVYVQDRTGLHGYCYNRAAGYERSVE